MIKALNLWFLNFFISPMSFSDSFFPFLLATAFSCLLTLMALLSPTSLEPSSNFLRPKDAHICLDVRQDNLDSVHHDQITIFIFCLAL